MRTLTIAVDLDGTLAEYNGWCGREHIGKPLPGAVAAMQAMVDQGHRVMIFTCRCSNELSEEFTSNMDAQASAEIIYAWLSEHGFPPVHVWTGAGKPMADLYIDDRALTVAPQIDPNSWKYALAVVRVKTVVAQPDEHEQLHALGLLEYQRGEWQP